MGIQDSYTINPGLGFIGDIARPSEPHARDSGPIHVPTGATRIPRPGDAVYWDTTEDAFAIPTTAAQLLLVCGILTYRSDIVPNASSTVEYADGDMVEVLTFGTIWVQAGSAMEYNQIIGWDLADWEWDPDTRVTAVTDIAALPVVCVSKAVVADGIAEARIGFGRVI